jgi:cyclohexanone monooxygenase
MKDSATRLPSDVIVVGAGFAGLFALHRLRQQGFRVKVFEAAEAVGGTWYWNRYPGARCDVQSLMYCYMFDERLHREWTWSERYATQPEILRYLNFVADRLHLRKDIAFNERIVRATFDQELDCWTVETDRGDEASANYVIMATGALSVGRLPSISGLESFRGQCYHTGTWPEGGVELAHRQVGVIGTGSSAVQAIPEIARVAGHLTVFQRTPAFVAPASNGPITALESERFNSNFASYRALRQRGEVQGSGDLIISDHLAPSRRRIVDVVPDERQAILEARWQVGGLSIVHAFADIMVDSEANRVIADFFRVKIHEAVKDPTIAETLTPKDYPFGSKRVCLGSNYFETFNRPNVTLVDTQASPIEAFTHTGLRTTERQYDFDVIVLATGFDALTGALSLMDIRGLNGKALVDAWAEGPQSYLGLAVASFPNLFIVNGPGSPGILVNVVSSIEQHVEWMVDLLVYARDRRFTRIEADPTSQTEWTQKVAAAAAKTLFMKGKSWYMKNVPGKPRIFMPYIDGLGVYSDICQEIASQSYPGFLFSQQPGSGANDTARGGV